MDDAELTRLAIAEIVREMGEVKEPPVQERKINPIAKPNKRFLGRTLNSMLSHNKRKNDRTQENCRKKLKELDQRREIIKRMRSRSRSGSWELVLSSSSDEDHSKEVKKKRKYERKTKHKEHKKSIKRKSKSKKSNRRKSRNSSSSSDSSESSSSTSRSSCRSKKNKLRKSSKHKKRKVLQTDINTIEGVPEEIYYEPDINAAIEFDAALMANNYRQHQIQQLVYYQTLLADHESSEIEALKEELRISDSEVTESQKENGSICSAVSSLNLNESSSDVSEMLQISLSSATSSGSDAKSNTNVRKKKVKGKHPKAGLHSDNFDVTNSNAVIWELDSDSSNSDNICEIKENSEKQSESGECICITSESEATTNDDSESENSTNDKDIKYSNNTNERHTLCHAEGETVTVLSSSESDVEIITLSNANEMSKKLPDAVTTAITSQFGDPVCKKQSELVLCVPETNATSMSEESRTLNGPNESAQKSPDPVMTAIRSQSTDSMSIFEKKSHLALCGSDTNAIFISEEDSVARAPEKTTHFSIEVNTLVTTTECSSTSIKVDATETEMPFFPLKAQQTLIKEIRIPESNESTLGTSLAHTDSFINAVCESNSGDIKTVGTDVETTASIDQENILTKNEMSSKVVNEPIKDSVDEIPSNLSPSSRTGPSVNSPPKAIYSITPPTTIDNTELNLDLIENQSAITSSESVDA